MKNALFYQIHQHNLLLPTLIRQYLYEFQLLRQQIRSQLNIQNPNMVNILFLLNLIKVFNQNLFLLLL